MRRGVLVRTVPLFAELAVSLCNSPRAGVPTMLMIGQPQLGTAFHGQTVVYIVQMPDVAQARVCVRCLCCRAHDFACVA